MNKNVVFGGIALLSIAIVAGLLLWEPEAQTPSFESGTVKEEATYAPQIAIKEKKEQKVRTAASSSKPTKPKKKIDPRIKAATIDHYNTYLIQLIDDNPADKDIHITKDPNSYKYVEGKISGKEFVMRVPVAVVDKPGIKLKITDLKTKETKTIDASFLSELDSIPRGGSLRVDLDFNDPKDIRTEAKLPDENPPFPGM